jgi:pyruvate dehydrogenase E1 component alpha subunit
VAKGGDFRQMYAELFGKSTGYCRGKGGSMHIADLDLGMLGANGIVGGGPPIAVGAAIATKLQGRGKVTVSFTGDGGTNQGTVFEAMNMAVVLNVPTVFVYEDNGYSEHTGSSYAVGCGDIAERTGAFGMPVFKADGSDFFSVCEAAGGAIARARAGNGPAAVVCKTTRYYGHFEGDPQLYRAKDEVQSHRESMDCLKNFRAACAARSLLDAAVLDAVDAEIATLIDAAVTAAKASPAPPPSQLTTDVYISY